LHQSDKASSDELEQQTSTSGLPLWHPACDR
jgi:hypothetical protein